MIEAPGGLLEPSLLLALSDITSSEVTLMKCVCVCVCVRLCVGWGVNTHIHIGEGRWCDVREVCPC